MTREELIADLDKAVADFAAQLAEKGQQSTGIPRPPNIEVTESQFDPSKTNLQLGAGPQTGLPPEGGGGPPGGFVYGACCVGTDCSIKTKSECDAAGGTWHPGADCTPNPCVAPTGACCTPSGCSVLSETACVDAGGTFLGAGTNCDNCVHIAATAAFSGTITNPGCSGTPEDCTGRQAVWGPCALHVGSTSGPTTFNQDVNGCPNLHIDWFKLDFDNFGTVACMSSSCPGGSHIELQGIRLNIGPTGITVTPATPTYSHPFLTVFCNGTDCCSTLWEDAVNISSTPVTWDNICEAAGTYTIPVTITANTPTPNDCGCGGDIVTYSFTATVVFTIVITHL